MNPWQFCNHDWTLDWSGNALAHAEKATCARKPWLLTWRRSSVFATLKVPLNLWRRSFLTWVKILLFPSATWPSNPSYQENMRRKLPMLGTSQKILIWHKRLAISLGMWQKEIGGWAWQSCCRSHVTAFGIVMEGHCLLGLCTQLT